MNAKETLVSVIALASAFVGCDYLYTIEPSEHTHVITEDCTVTREITKEL